MSEDRYTRITLRIPKEVHKALQEEADARSHSMNAEIIQRLEWTLISPHFVLHSPGGPEPMKSYSLKEELDKIEYELADMDMNFRMVEKEEISLTKEDHDEIMIYMDKKKKHLQSKKEAIEKRMASDWVRNVLKKMEDDEDQLFKEEE